MAIRLSPASYLNLFSFVLQVTGLGDLLKILATPSVAFFTKDFKMSYVAGRPVFFSSYGVYQTLSVKDARTQLDTAKESQTALYIAWKDAERNLETAKKLSASEADLASLLTAATTAQGLYDTSVTDVTEATTALTTAQEAEVADKRNSGFQVKCYNLTSMVWVWWIRLTAIVLGLQWLVNIIYSITRAYKNDTPYNPMLMIADLFMAFALYTVTTRLGLYKKTPQLKVCLSEMDSMQLLASVAMWIFYVTVLPLFRYRVFRKLEKTTEQQLKDKQETAARKLIIAKELALQKKEDAKVDAKATAIKNKVDREGSASPVVTPPAAV
jgi:uncharacterized membrane protein YjfL (UPF0719 family)